MSRRNVYSRSQLSGLVILRILIGWYFMYEGLAKIFNPNWSSYPYLLDSKGFFAPIFISMTDYPFLMDVINYVNMYGLTIIGLCMILGCFVSIANVGAIGLLSLYYLSHPPLIGVHYLIPPEGSYLWVDKNLVMLGAVMVQHFFPSSHYIGIDRYIFRKDRKTQEQ